MTCPESSPLPISPVFNPAYHAVVVPDIGDAYCLTDTTLQGLRQQLTAYLGASLQLYVFGPDGARYPVLRSGHLATPEGIFPLWEPGGVCEEIDDTGFLPGAIVFGDAAVKASAAGGNEVASDVEFEDEDDFPGL